MTTSATIGAKPAHENRGSFAREGSIGARVVRVGSALCDGSGALRCRPPKRPGPNIDRLPDHWQTCMCKAPRGNDKC